MNFELEYKIEAERFLKSKELLGDSNIEKLADQWNVHLKDFDPTNSQSFYNSWVAQRGAVNISDQFKRPYVQDALLQYLKDFEEEMLDFGCGTAGLTLTWQKHYSPKAKVILADVRNLAHDFVSWYALNHKEVDIQLVDISLENISDTSLGAIVCTHVLEHLAEPSKTFRLLDSKMKSGGILLLEAPWGGHPEHLEVAPHEWVLAGGQECLLTNYKRIGNLGSCELSGVYKKKEIIK